MRARSRRSFPTCTRAGYSNRVNKRALIESDKLTLREAHALELFKNEGMAPDAQQRVAKFFKRDRGPRKP